MFIIASFLASFLCDEIQHRLFLYQRDMFMSDFSLGVIFHPKFPPETIADYARRAEAGGFDELWFWEDSFYAGGLTSAAIALSATTRLKVCIGIMAATVRNPLFSAMEITTLARAYPGRFVAGFGHGVDRWLKQIGATPTSSLKALEETVTTVRALLKGEEVTFQGAHVSMDHVQMHLTPHQVPPLYVGAMREKTQHLAGRVGDGTILTEMSSPAYVRWAREQIAVGMAETGRTDNHVVTFCHAKVGEGSRDVVRGVLSQTLSWAIPHLQALGILDEVQALYREHGAEGIAPYLKDEWLDALSISGTPEQAVDSIYRFAEAGANSIVLLPPDGDAACLDEYIRDVLPLLKR
jgi:5,10-methylenetetrahydromethanopterin reductase